MKALEITKHGYDRRHLFLFDGSLVGDVQGWETNDEEGPIATTATNESVSTAASSRSQSAPQTSEGLVGTKKSSARPKTSNVSYGIIKEVHPPSNAIIARAMTPPAPVLPRRAISSKSSGSSRQPVPGVLVNKDTQEVYYGTSRNDVKRQRCEKCVYI